MAFVPVPVCAAGLGDAPRVLGSDGGDCVTEIGVHESLLLVVCTDDRVN